MLGAHALLVRILSLREVKRDARVVRAARDAGGAVLNRQPAALLLPLGGEALLLLLLALLLLERALLLLVQCLPLLLLVRAVALVSKFSVRLSVPLLR